MLYEVNTPSELYDAISQINADSSGIRADLKLNSYIDLNGQSQGIVLNNLTTITGNGYKDSGIIFPIQLQIQINFSNFICENIMLQGPHPNRTIGSDPTTGGIYIADRDGALINNCEIKHFSYYGLLLRRSKNNIVENCWIHDNKKDGLGYGVVLEGDGFFTARYNIMELNRHCIAGSGELGQGYIAHDNVFGEPGNNNASRLDMHGDGEITGGTYMEIYNNTFTSVNGVDIGIRGVPTDKIKIYNNTFAHKCERDAITQQQNSFLFGRLDFRKMEVFGNYYNNNACSRIGFEQSFLALDNKGSAYQYKFDSDCYYHTQKKLVGNSFLAFKNIWPNEWLNGSRYDLIVETTSKQFLILDSIGGSFTSSKGIRLSQELSNYRILKVGNVLTTRKNFIGQKNDNNLYEIQINSDGSIQETLLKETTEEFSTLELGRFNDPSRQSILGYKSDGTSIVYHNNSGAIQDGVSLGIFPGHTFYGSAEYVTNGYDDIVSSDKNNIFLWRWNSGTLLDSAPTIRSGNSGDIYKDLIPVNHEGVMKLCSFKKNGDVEILKFESSFKDPVPVGALISERIFKLN